MSHPRTMSGADIEAARNRASKKEKKPHPIKVVDGDEPASESSTPEASSSETPTTRQRRANYASFFEQDFVRSIIAPRLNATIAKHGVTSLVQLNQAFEKDHSLPDAPLYVGTAVLDRWLELLGYSLKRTTVLFSNSNPTSGATPFIPSVPKPSPQLPLPGMEDAVTFDNETPADSMRAGLNPDVFGRL